MLLFQLEVLLELENDCYPSRFKDEIRKSRLGTLTVNEVYQEVGTGLERTES